MLKTSTAALLSLLMLLLTLRTKTTHAFLSSLPNNNRPLGSITRRKSSTITMANEKQLVVDPFCFRQFAEHDASKTYVGAVLYVLQHSRISSSSAILSSIELR